MALRMRVESTTIEGKEQEAIGPYMALGDIIAFEERFGVHFDELYVDARDDEGKMQRVKGPAYTEKRAAFFAWRTLGREGVDVGEFDAWTDQLDRLLIRLAEDDGLDPTAPEAQANVS